jgi:hypothetical protein
MNGLLRFKSRLPRQTQILKIFGFNAAGHQCRTGSRFAAGTQQASTSQSGSKLQRCSKDSLSKLS